MTDSHQQLAVHRRIAACVAAGLALLAGAPAAHADAPQRLVVFGHSWAAGHFPDPGLASWADRVAAAQGVALDNRAVGASEAAQTADAVDGYEPQAGDEVVVEAMLNDVRRYGDAGRHPFVRQMRRILDHLGDGWPQPAAVVVCVDAAIRRWRGAPKFFAGYDQGSDRALRRYAVALRRLAVGYPWLTLRVVDLRRGWRPARDIGADGIHPGEAGTARIARRVQRALDGLRL